MKSFNIHHSMQVRQHKLEISYILNAATRDDIGPVHNEDNKCKDNYKIVIIGKSTSIQYKIICIALFTKQSLQSRFFRKLSFYNRFIYCINLIYLTYGKIRLISVYYF